MASIYKDYFFYLSCDISLDLKVFVDYLDVTDLPSHFHDQAEEFIVTARVIDGNFPITACIRATHTPYKHGTSVHWGEWLVLPVKIRDLPKTAQVVLELWTVGMQLLSGTTLRCFDSKLRLKRGIQKGTLWPCLRKPHVTGPTSISMESKSLEELVPDVIEAVSKGRGHSGLAGSVHLDLISTDPDYHLIKIVEAYELSEIPRTSWIDRMTFAQLRKELVSRRMERYDRRRSNSLDRGKSGARNRTADPHRADVESPVAAAASLSDAAVPGTCSGGRLEAGTSSARAREPLHLYVHFPAFDHPVIFEDTIYSTFVSSAGTNTGYPHPPLVVREPSNSEKVRTAAGQPSSYWNDAGNLTMISDPEVDIENPVEAKYYKLARSLMRNIVDPNLKPNRGELARFQAVIAAPTLEVRMAADLKELLWKFRYSLTNNKKALVKFLVAVDWEDDEDAREAVSLLAKWAPIDTEDALRLLSPDFRAKAVREHAVNALRRASDDDLVLYLLQLVQALRYEADLVLAAASSASPPTAGTAISQSVAAAPGPSPSAADTYVLSTAYTLSPLADFLIDRACGSLELANFLNWYLRVELEDPRVGAVFSLVHANFLNALRSPAANPEIHSAIESQGIFLQQLAECIREGTQSKKDSVSAKMDKLNSMLSSSGTFAELCNLAETVTSPLNTGIKLSGIAPKGCRIFKSAKYPTMVTFTVHASSEIDWTAKVNLPGLQIHSMVADAARATVAALASRAVRPMKAVALKSPVPIEDLMSPTTETAYAATVAMAVSEAVSSLPAQTPPATYKLMFKSGDDMRQDQLIIQMIRLMDQQLKRVGLDLRLTPYRVLATSTTTGMMEMVLNSEEVSAVLAKHKNDIMSFFLTHHPKAGEEYGIDPDTMDTYVKSSAGYCVITYLLGIGDRHLDNIMLTRDGHLFHIDFGYIFGRDPKPLPPPMRLTKEMIDGMGGPESSNYQRFKSYCCQAYNILRKSANLILSLLNLMRDAGIVALAENPDVTIAKLQEKYRLDIDDEAADQVFLKLVDESVAALFPAFFEVIHKIRVAMR